MSTQTMQKVYSSEKLEYFKGKIVAKKKEVQRQLGELSAGNINKNGTHDTSPSFKDVQDDVVMSESKEHLKVHYQQHIQRLNNALLRIENRRYGICAETGELIPENVLEVNMCAILSPEGIAIRKRK